MTPLLGLTGLGGGVGSNLVAGASPYAQCKDVMPIFYTDEDGSDIEGGESEFWEDAASSSLHAALPLYENTNDYSATIKGSGANLTVSTVGDPSSSSTQSKWYGKSYYFDGDDALTFTGFGSTADDTDFCIEAWIWANTSQNTHTRLFSSNEGVNSGEYTMFRFWQSGGNTGWAYYVGDSGGSVNWGQNASEAAAGGVPLEQWVHCALVREGSTISFFVNGTRKHTQSASHSFTNTTWVLGWGYGGEYFQGYMSDARAYKGSSKYTAADSSITIFPC